LCKETIRMVKLLAPVSSFDSAVDVVKAGADELYCGVRIPSRLKYLWLNRRPECEVPTYEELERIVKYAHSRKVKVILTTVMPFMTQSVEGDLRSHLRSCLNQGVDALIVTDLGILSLLRRMSVEVPLHASTFFAAMNLEGVEFLKELGFKRVILERQLTIDEIREIVQGAGDNVEVEVFFHGGGCSNYNASCYLLHWRLPRLAVKERVNPCMYLFDVYDASHPQAGRLFENVPVLDAFTWCSACRVRQLVRTGITGFKIVGRCLDREAQAFATEACRSLIDLAEKEPKQSSFEEKLEALKRKIVAFNLIKWGGPSLCATNRCYYSPFFTNPYPPFARAVEAKAGRRR